MTKTNNTELDSIIAEFKGYCNGENSFDELDFKEALLKYIQATMLEIIGDDIDLSKYEDAGVDGGIGVKVDESDEISTGASISNLVNYVSDKAQNELRAELRTKLGIKEGE